MLLIPVPSRWYEPLGESLSRLTVDSKTTSEFTVFNLVIRLSKVNCWPFFSFHPVESCVELLPAVVGSPFSVMQGSVVWSGANNFLFSLLESLTDKCNMRIPGTGHACRFGTFFFLWSLVRFNCARNSRVDDLSCPESCEMTAEGLEPYHKTAWVVDASVYKKMVVITSHQFCNRNRLTVLPCFPIDFRAIPIWCGRWAGLLLRWTTSINLVLEIWCSLKLSQQLRTS